MSKIDQILSKAVATRNAIENRVSEKVNAVLDPGALSSPMAKLKTPRGGEVTLFGHFAWNPELSGQEEIDTLIAGDWSPSTLDFMEVTGLSPNFALQNFEALLASIADYKEDSISRLNFWSHGDSVSLGMSGSIEPGSVSFHSYIDGSKMEFYAREGLTITDTSKGKKRVITLDDVRRRFKGDAVFVLYACNAGVNEELLKALRDLLQVTVIGFKHSILYCPPVQHDPPFRRKGTKIGISKKDGGCTKNETTSDWRSLTSDDSAVRFEHSEK